MTVKIPNAKVLSVDKNASICPYAPNIYMSSAKCWPSLFEQKMGANALLSAFERYYGANIYDNREQSYLIREYFYGLLAVHFPHLLPKMQPEKIYLWNQIKKIIHNHEEAREITRLSHIVPPEQVHRMQRNDPLWIGDIYSSEMVLKALGESKLSVEKGGYYLDFGCSSGSLIRILAAVYPDSVFSGVDPIPSSIEWAQEHLPMANFAVSNQLPPLSFEHHSLDGVSAISIWSHFAEDAALEWFDEMHRIIKPGGWLLFTTHGLHTVRFHLNLKKKTAAKVQAIFEGLIASNYVFEDVFGADDGKTALRSSWGNCYVRFEWFALNLSDTWELRYFNPGMNQNNQDLYVFTAKS